MADDLVVQRFLASLEEARHLPEGEAAAFILRDVLELPAHDAARLLGMKARAAGRHLGTARERVGLVADADAGVIGQWLVTELIAPSTRALQLHLFQGSGDRAGRHE